MIQTTPHLPSIPSGHHHHQRRPTFVVQKEEKTSPEQQKIDQKVKFLLPVKTESPTFQIVASTSSSTPAGGQQQQQRMALQKSGGGRGTAPIVQTSQRTQPAPLTLRDMIKTPSMLLHGKTKTVYQVNRSGGGGGQGLGQTRRPTEILAQRQNIRPIVPRSAVAYTTKKATVQSQQMTSSELNQRNILRTNQLVQHADYPPQQNNRFYRPMVVQTQQESSESQPQQHQHYQTGTTRQNQNHHGISSRKRYSRSPPTPENEENLESIPSKRSREDQWERMSMTSSPPSQEIPRVNPDGSLPDLVRNIAGFEIRVIRAKDPEMRIFPY